jgi:antagonist of KipI
MGFLVRAPGTLSLLVDAGRPRSRSLGVPLGGPADRRSHALGNALVGNCPDTTALEFALAGPTLEATETHYCVVAGAAFDVHLNDKPVTIGKTVTVHPGDFLQIGTPSHGLRGYFCVHGGFHAPNILGSRSAFSPIQRGQLLECPASQAISRYAPELRWLREDAATLRVLPGQHAQLFRGSEFWTWCFQVTGASDRMGLRLQGPPLEREPAELLSAPVCPGTVQVTNDGQLVVLGVDAQTIGGYPRLAHVIRADLDLLAQLRPGDTVRLKPVSLDDAEQADFAWRAELADWTTRLLASFPPTLRAATGNGATAPVS